MDKINFFPDNLDVQSKKIILRLDLNVPIKDKIILDDTRISLCLPFVNNLIEKKAKIIIVSHLGRPKGTKNPRLSLLPVANRLQELLQQTIYFCDAMDEPETLTRSLKAGDIVLLENLRFEAGEETDDQRFAQKLSMIGDFYVNDAFGLVHRAHASVHALAKIFASSDSGSNKAFAGFLIEKETAALDVLLSRNSKATTVAVLGGSKVSDKIVLVENLARHSRNILIGGAMGYTLMKANKIDVGTSKVEKDKLSIARELLDQCAKMKVTVHLPIDHLCKAAFAEEEEPVVVDSAEIPEGLMGLDIGPKTRELYSSLVESAGCVFWNGPMGVFEWENTHFPFRGHSGGARTAKSRHVTSRHANTAEIPSKSCFVSRSSGDARSAEMGTPLRGRRNARSV